MSGTAKRANCERMSVSRRVSFDNKLQGQTHTVDGISKNFMIAEVHNFGATPAMNVKFIGYISWGLFLRG